MFNMRYAFKKAFNILDFHYPEILNEFKQMIHTLCVDKELFLYDKKPDQQDLE